MHAHVLVLGLVLGLVLASKIASTQSVALLSHTTVHKTSTQNLFQHHMSLSTNPPLQESAYRIGHAHLDAHRNVAKYMHVASATDVLRAFRINVTGEPVRISF